MVAAAVVGSAAIGAVGSSMAADAAGDAAAGQQRAAADANALQQQIYDRNTENFQPYLDAGGAGLNALLYRLGLGTGTGNGRQMTEQEIRDELRGQYTTGGAAPVAPENAEIPRWVQQRGPEWMYNPATGQYGYRYYAGSNFGGGADYQEGDNFAWYTPEGTARTPEVVDEAGLEKAVQDRLAQQNAAMNDPLYGSLMQSYREYTPYKAYQDYKAYVPFSEAQFQADPGYQFRLDQGNQALQNMAAATGNLNSGRALKDALTFNSGQAAQEYQAAYGRYNNDYRTGFDAHTQNYLTGLNSHINDYNAGFNAFNTNQTNQFNRLAAIAGMGQSSASALAGVGQNYANQVSNNLAQSANAQAAGTIGQSNAINQGLGQVANAGLNYAALNNQGAYTSGYTPTSAATGNVNSLYGAWRPVA